MHHDGKLTTMNNLFDESQEEIILVAISTLRDEYDILCFCLASIIWFIELCYSMKHAYLTHVYNEIWTLEWQP